MRWIVAAIAGAAMVLAQSAGARAGQAPVGVQKLLVVDESRPKLCSNGVCPLGRQIPVLLFYPAASAKGHTASFGELGRIGGGKSADELRRALDKRNRGMLAYTAQKYRLGDAAAVTQRVMHGSAGVILDAPAARARHPLLLYAGGANFMVQENVTLWRALAERGYVVAAIPTIGTRSVEFSADAEGLEALARDMEAVLGKVHASPMVDDRKLGLLGFSYGGAAALLVAMRQPSAAAVVGYDASFISKTYGKALVDAPQFSPDRLTAPLLDIHARADDATPEIVGKLRYSHRRSIEIPGAEHIDFTQMPEVALAQFGDRQLPLRSLAERARAHRLIIAQTIGFLASALEAQGSAAADQLPKDWALTGRPALAIPPTPAQLVETGRQQGYEAALEQLMTVKRSDPMAALLSGRPLNDYGYSILGRDPHSALIAFRLNLAANPQRADLWDSLADGFIALNDTGCAAATYRGELALLARQASLSDMDRGVEKTARKFLSDAPQAQPCAVELPQ